MVPTDLDPIERHPKAVGPGEIIRLHNPMCFGCGPQSPRGLRLEIRAGADFTVDAKLVVEPWMEGGPGVLHGGILSTAFDEVMGTVPLLAGPAVVTVHMEVDFVSPIPTATVLNLHAEILGVQRRKVYTRAIAYFDDPEKPVASAHGIFVAIKAREHFAEHIGRSQMSDQDKDKMRPRD